MNDPMPWSLLAQFIAGFTGVGLALVFASMLLKPPQSDLAQRSDDEDFMREMRRRGR